MRQLTRMVMAASSVAMVAGGLLATGGAGTAMASQVRTEHVSQVRTEHVFLFHNGRTDTPMTVRFDSRCTATPYAGVYYSAYDYWTAKAYFTQNSCGSAIWIQAYIECSGHYIYGSMVYGATSSHASFAACNKTYPTFDGVYGDSSGS
jgi:hypothetical protein